MPKDNPYSRIFIQDGLSLKDAQDRYQTRRCLFRNTHPGHNIVAGIDRDLDATEPWSICYSPLYQDPLFLYLSGINQPGSVLYLGPNHQETLFIAPKNAKKTFWEGTHFGSGARENIQELQSITGIQDIKPLSELYPTLDEHFHQDPHINLFWHDKSPKRPLIKDSHFRFKQRLSQAMKRRGQSPQFNNIAHTATQQRLVLDPIDQQNLEKANIKTSQIFTLLCQKLSKMQSEQDVNGLIKGEIARLSTSGQSFPPIVAYGKNATTLHYHRNESPFQNSGMLLLDFGVREHSMPADISRSIPINGRFNPLEKCLYQLVLETQKYVQSLVKEGVTLNALNQSCWTFLEQALKDRFLSQGGSMTRDYQQQPHQVGHLIGIAVHDGDPYRNDAKHPLKAGMVISNEPGLYGHFSLETPTKKYEADIGIRIEDNLLVTKKGCQNLSESCPKEIQELEALIN